MNDDHDELPTRRTVLMWGALGAFAAPTLAAAGAEPAAPAGATPNAGGAAASAGAAPAASAPLPAATLERYMKLHASTSGGESPWYYTGRIYAVRERQAPQLLFNFEGTEIYWVRRIAAGEWQLRGSTLTFFRDAATGAYLDSWVNPVTGRTIEVRPNVLRTQTGDFSVITAAANQLSSRASLPWQVEVNSVGGICWLTTSRWLAAAPQPWIEVQTMLGSEAELGDKRVTSATSTFSSTYLAPWLRWMEMGDAPGHLVWHAAGRKLKSRKDMPAPYLERAERTSPVHFTEPS